MFDDEVGQFSRPRVLGGERHSFEVNSTQEWTPIPGPRFLGADVSFEEYIRRMVLRGLPGVRAQVLAAGRDNFADRQGECPVAARLRAQGKVLMEDASELADAETGRQAMQRTPPQVGGAVFRGQPIQTRLGCRRT